MVFYKKVHNIILAFNPTTTKYLDFFFIKILVFLSAMIYYSIIEYQSGNKIVRSFYKKNCTKCILLYIVWVALRLIINMCIWILELLYNYKPKQK